MNATGRLSLTLPNQLLAFTKKMLNIDYINFNYKIRGTKVVVNVSTPLRKEL
ncbi:hypothetical protein AU14_18500 [Marinobacter similis]|uniref:Uncharacterized protein n=1 Tax=Marinobacter similis TaxID=1420916 RepID=W5YN10_9GAMM|nr:hypothetical protein AU14_18500 [Marinobacter similis]